jgi:hypothetical protein
VLFDNILGISAPKEIQTHNVSGISKILAAVAK